MTLRTFLKTSILAAAAWCAVGDAACAEEAPRLLSFVQYWTGDGKADVPQTNGCPGLADGKLTEGTYRAQMVSWPGEAGQSWGTVAIGWKIGPGGKEEAVVSFGGGGGAAAKSDPNLAILSPYLPASTSDGKSQALLRLLCGFDSPNSGTHTRIDDALKTVAAPGSDALQALRDFIAPKDKANNVPPLPELIEQAKKSAGSQYARTSGEAIDQRLQALHKSFLARLVSGMSGNGASATIAQSKTDESGKGVTADNPLDGEVKDLRNKVKSLESNIDAIGGNTVMSGAAVIASLISVVSILFLVFLFHKREISLYEINGENAKIRNDLNNVTQKIEEIIQYIKYLEGRFHEKTRENQNEHPSGNSLYNDINSIDDQFDEINLQLNNLKERIISLEFAASQIKIANSRQDKQSQRDEHTSPPPGAQTFSSYGVDRSGARDHHHRDDDRSVATDGRNSPSSNSHARGAAGAESPVEDGSALVALPPASPLAEESVVSGDGAGWRLSEAWLNQLASILFLNEQNRRRLAEAASLESLGDALAGSVVPVRADPQTLERVGQWLKNVSGNRLELILPAIGSRPSGDEAEKVAERPIERGIYGLVAAVVRPGLRVDGKIMRRAEIEQGV